MALLGNYNVLLKTCGNFSAGSTVSDNRYNFSKSGKIRARYIANACSRLSGIPDSYEPPGSWMIPQKGGMLGSTNNMNGFGTLTPAMSSGINITSPLTGVGTISTATASNKYLKVAETGIAKAALPSLKYMACITLK